MKRTLFASALVLMAASMQAQDTYTNFSMTNTTDVFGTARYVGMGGAMGALGADISAMSNNPATLGLFRKNDLSITMGGVIQDAKPYEVDNRGHYSFDQAGFVAAFPNSDRSSFFNFGLNFQKKADFGHSLDIGQSGALGGFSQAAQLMHLYDLGYSYYGSGNDDYFPCSLPYTAYNAYLYDVARQDGSGNMQLTSEDFAYYRTTSGNLYGLDLALSGNIRDRVYLGLGFGIDFLNYKAETDYLEHRHADELVDGSNIQDYTHHAYRHVDGNGFNLKFGTIIRPVEENPFRFGITIETPSWYVLSQRDTYYWIASKWQYNETASNQLNANVYDYQPSGKYAYYDSPDNNQYNLDYDFNVHSPWRFRFSAGSTTSVGESNLAWDVEYEYALYNRATTGQPRDYYNDGPSIGMRSDAAMNQLTRNSINGVHNLRAGAELWALPEFAVRLGYNFWSKPMKDGARLDQSITSDYVDFIPTTDYINLGATNMLSFGFGYRHKGFYADFAYKYRAQRGDFYAFDDSYQFNDAQFHTTAQSLTPEKVNLDRHTITFTLGYKF